MNDYLWLINTIMDKCNIMLAVISCMFGVTYLWLIPYVTEFSARQNKKLVWFNFNNSSMLSHYTVFQHIGLDEYKVFIKPEKQNKSDVYSCYVFSLSHRLNFAFENVTLHFSFLLPRLLYSVIKISCVDDSQFIFTTSNPSILFPMMPKDSQTFVCPVQYKCIFDTLNKQAKSCFVEVAGTTTNSLRMFHLPDKNVSLCDPTLTFLLAVSYIT